MAVEFKSDQLLVQAEMRLNFRTKRILYFFYLAERLNFSRWMEKLPFRFYSIPLTNIAIPGSHDSCSYSLSPRSSYSIGLDSKVGKIFAMNADNEEYRGKGSRGVMWRGKIRYQSKPLI